MVAAKTGAILAGRKGPALWLRNGLSQDGKERGAGGRYQFVFSRAGDSAATDDARARELCAPPGGPFLAAIN
jgi:hypothetical protein